MKELIEKRNRVDGTGNPVLNVMSILNPTYSNGPGSRACVWLQFCPIRCPGCYQPESWPDTEASIMSPQEIVEQIADAEGVTISGGEPMSQPLALYELLKLLHCDGLCKLPMGIICFTGYEFDTISSDPDCVRCLDLLDLLVAGPYVESVRSDVGIGGSTNKFFWYNPASGRGSDLIEPSSVEFDRSVEVHLGGSSSQEDVFRVTGFPPGRLSNLGRLGISRSSNGSS